MNRLKEQRKFIQVVMGTRQIGKPTVIKQVLKDSDMKKRITTYFIGILALAMLCSGCSTNRMAAGDPGAVLAGASIGGNVGGAIGGLIGESNRGWRGGYRGSAIGTIVGTIAGAAIEALVLPANASPHSAIRTWVPTSRGTVAVVMTKSSAESSPDTALLLSSDATMVTVFFRTEYRLPSGLDFT